MSKRRKVNSGRPSARVVKRRARLQSNVAGDVFEMDVYRVMTAIAKGEVDRDQARILAVMIIEGGEFDAFLAAEPGESADRVDVFLGICRELHRARLIGVDDVGGFLVPPPVEAMAEWRRDVAQNLGPDVAAEVRPYVPAPPV